MSGQWVVLKFGGTSVATRARWESIGEQIRARQAEGLRPVVVCSAVSGISNNLEALLKQAPLGNHQDILDGIVARHQVLADEMGVDMEAEIGGELERLRRLALGASLTQEVSPRLHAQVMSCGELMSTRLGAAFLRAQGLGSLAWVDARECLRSVAHPGEDKWRLYTSAACDDHADEALQGRFEALGAEVILTQGFIAHNEADETVLLGRGGSDTSASYFAARLGAARCEIWTDVPGMFTANPRQLQSARLLRSLSYDEAQEIASTGAKVLHPRCIPPMRRHGIPLHVRCTTRPELPGTVISHQSADATPKVKAISTKDHLTLVVMDTPGMWQQVGFLADIFACFKEHGLSIDLVSTSEMNVTVSLDPASNTISDAVLESLRDDLASHCRVKVIGPCSAISLVGRNIRAILHKLGPALSVFEELQVHLLSQAASDLNLSFVVDEDHADRLTKELHTLLFDAQIVDQTFGPSWQDLFAPQTPAPLLPPGQSPWWKVRREALLDMAQTQSPLYAYDEQALNDAATSLTALKSVDKVFFAMKANPCEGILRQFEALGIGFECVSPGELERVLTLFPQIDRQRVIFTPNFAPRQEYEAAFEHGVWVTLDNLHPLEQWPEVFAGRQVLVRIDPGQGKGHHDYVKTAGAQSKFGVAPVQFDRLQELVEAHNVQIIGLHAHTGSGIQSPEEWAQTALILSQVAQRFPSVKLLDLGGGLGVPERLEQRAMDLKLVDDALAAFRAAHPSFEIWIEPGRYLVAKAGVLLARVNQLKDKGSVRYVGINTGMNSLIRPALYGAFHEIVNLTRLDAPATDVYNVVGPICESGDTLGHRRRLPPTEEGDILLIATAGAYGRAMSSHYNLRPPAREVIVTPQGHEKVTPSVEQ